MTHSVIPLIFVRHGQTEWSLSGRYQGRSDLPLIAQGREQAFQTGLRLRGEGVGSILTSPLRRARETAEIIAETLGLDAPDVDHRLAELAYGAWEGLTQAEVRSRWPDQLRQWKRAPESASFPDGECLADLRERLRLFLVDPMWVMHHGGGVLVVSHAGVIRIALLEAAQQPLSMFRRIAVSTASMHRLVLQRQQGRISLSEQQQERASCVLQ